MEILTAIYNAIDWQLVTLLLGSGAAVAYLSQLIKKWKDIDNSATMQTLAGVFSWVAAQAQHLIANPASPLTLPAKYAGWIFIASQFVYQLSKLLSMLFARLAEKKATQDIPAATGEFI